MTQHSDSIESDLEHTNHRTNNFTSFNGVNGEVVLQHPLLNEEYLAPEWPLIVRMAKVNRARFNAEQNDDRPPDDVLFDNELCNAAEKALENAGLDTELVAIEKLRGLLLSVAYGYTYKELSKHVSRYSKSELKQMGLKQPYSQSTYRKAAARLKTANCHGKLERACLTAVVTVFKNGIPIPDRVTETFNTFDFTINVDGTGAEFRGTGRDAALYKTVNKLLDIVTNELTLQRGNNSQQKLRTIFGAFANTALSDGSLSRHDDVTHHRFDLSDALSGTMIYSHLRELEVFEVNEMFDDVNKALLEYVLRKAVSDPVTVSFDITKIQASEKTL